MNRGKHSSFEAVITKWGKGRRKPYVDTRPFVRPSVALH